jgi:glutathione peroxidase
MISALLCLATLASSPTFYDFSLTDIDGKPFHMKSLKGKVVMVVNVASKCGLTPQYEALEKLYREHKDEGLVVLGFPSNDFRGQEPGTEAEIKEFCQTKYSVTFPMFSKVRVTGSDKHPFFAWLQARSDRPNEEVEWNFGKYLISRKGEVAARFAPRTAPSDPAIVSAINKQLAQK